MKYCDCCVRAAVLEGEMYQLSHLLTDQKTVMTSMMELSLTGNKGLRLHRQTYKHMQADGCLTCQCYTATKLTL